ncbi:ABZJ_00895 family protein [Loktanella sp. S4079]|uniref:ABZJ_00895 family protein n=1 Tax=Loktanella sp. S4079 TaxID=579483 RepID=UPI000A973D29|nr:ABZJ_00895 family protein [Loktanella sp. S4079]
MNYKRYTAIIIGVTIGLPILLGMLRQLTGLNLSTGFTAIAPALVAALVEGQQFAKTHNRVPTGSETKSFVGFATLISAGFLILFSAAIITNVPGFGELLETPPAAWLIFSVLGFVVAMIALCNFAFLRMGAKNQLKAIQAGRSK